MPSRISLTSQGEDASLVLVGHISSDGVTIKIPYGVWVLQIAVRCGGATPPPLVKGGDQKLCWGRIFLAGGGNLRSDFDDLNLFQR